MTKHYVATLKFEEVTTVVSAGTRAGRRDVTETRQVTRRTEIASVTVRGETMEEVAGKIDSLNRILGVSSPSDIKDTDDEEDEEEGGF